MVEFGWKVRIKALVWITKYSLYTAGKSRYTHKKRQNEEKNKQSRRSLSTTYQQAVDNC